MLWIAVLIAPALTIWNFTVHTNGYIGSLQWVFLGVLWALLSRRDVHQALLRPCAAFVLGGVAFCAINPEMAAWIVGRSSAGSVVKISSERIAIWTQSLRVVAESESLGIVTGLGPEAYYEMRQPTGSARPLGGTRSAESPIKLAAP